MLNNLEIEEHIKKCLGEGVESVLNGSKESVDIYYVSPSDVGEYLKINHNINSHVEFDTNGWDWDYWIIKEIKDKYYILSGCGYYNNYVTFSIKED